MQLQTVILLSLVPQVLCCPRLFLQLLFSDRADAQAIAQTCKLGVGVEPSDRVLAFPGALENHLAVAPVNYSISAAAAISA